MASQITSLTIVYSTVHSGADQRKHQSSASLAFARGIHRWPVNSRTKGQWRGKCFHLMTSWWVQNLLQYSTWIRIRPTYYAKYDEEEWWEGWYCEPPSPTIWHENQYSQHDLQATADCPEDLKWYSVWSSEPGPRLNIKAVFSRYGDAHVKDKTVQKPSYL